jgi:hypothetical protein
MTKLWWGEQQIPCGNDRKKSRSKCKKQMQKAGPCSAQDDKALG